MIPLEDLVVGAVYKLNSRNLNLGVFTEHNSFIGIRTKFGNRFLDEELEYTTHKNYGTARAEAILGSIQTSIPLRETLGTKCEKCGQLVNFHEKRPEKEHWLHEDGTALCKEAWPISISNTELFKELDKFEKGDQK